MKSIKIPDSLHDLIKKYCIFNSSKIEDFVARSLSKDAKLVRFTKSLKTMRFDDGKKK